MLETLKRESIAATDVQQLTHGTTLVTNAVIERTGSHTALLATLGFRDSIEIGRENRQDQLVRPPDLYIVDEVATRARRTVKQSN